MILAATMWDDGLASDLPLMEMLRDLGAPAAFAISPATHSNNRSINDGRGDYGRKVAKSELKEYSDFEVCNHTWSHANLFTLTEAEAKAEILRGRQALEDIYGRSIPGFCYPFGVVTDWALKALKECQTLYGRTTESGCTSHTNNLLLHPTAHWTVNLENLIDRTTGRLILWGHTYEFKTKDDWSAVRRMYQLLVSHPRIKLVTFEQMMKDRKCHF